VVVQPRHQGLERVPQLRGGRHVERRADASATRVTDSGQCGSLGRGYRRRLARRAAWLRRGRATPGADARFARARAPGARSGVPRGPRGLFAEFQRARQKKGGSDASSGVASSKSDRGRTGDFEGAREGSGTSSFSRPRARDSWLGDAAPLGAFGDASKPGFYLQPTNCSRRARRGDTTERRRTSASPRDAAAFRARCPPRGRRPGRPRPRRRDGGGRVGATGAGRRGRRRCSFAPLARWRPRSAPRAPPAGARGSRDRDAAARDPRTRRGSPRPRRARPPPGTPPRLAAPGAPPRAIVTCRRERSAAT
jgi:hypothetical protein